VARTHLPPARLLAPLLLGAAAERFRSSSSSSSSSMGLGLNRGNGSRASSEQGADSDSTIEAIAVAPPPGHTDARLYVAVYDEDSGGTPRTSMSACVQVPLAAAVDGGDGNTATSSSTSAGGGAATTEGEDATGLSFLLASCRRYSESVLALHCFAALSAQVKRLETVPALSDADCEGIDDDALESASSFAAAPAHSSQSSQSSSSAAAAGGGGAMGPKKRGRSWTGDHAVVTPASNALTWRPILAQVNPREVLLGVQASGGEKRTIVIGVAGEAHVASLVSRRDQCATSLLRAASAVASCIAEAVSRAPLESGEGEGEADEGDKKKGKGSLVEALLDAVVAPWFVPHI
jgi:hypothetical protein